MKEVERSGLVLHADFARGCWAEESQAVALGLSARGIPVQLAPTGPLDPGRPDGVWSVAEAERLTRDHVALARSVLYQAGTPDEWNLEYYGRYRVARTAFGAERLPEGWARRCNEMDEVWVPNQFCLEGFAESGVEKKKLRIVRTGVDTQRFRPGLPGFDSLGKRRFCFLSVTDLHPRRGTDVLLRAYLEEF